MKDRSSGEIYLLCWWAAWNHWQRWWQKLQSGLHLKKALRIIILINFSSSNSFIIVNASAITFYVSLPVYRHRLTIPLHLFSRFDPVLKPWGNFLSFSRRPWTRSVSRTRLLPAFVCEMIKSSHFCAEQSTFTSSWCDERNSSHLTLTWQKNAKCALRHSRGGAKFPHDSWRNEKQHKQQ